MTILEKTSNDKVTFNQLINEQWSNAACVGYMIYACEKVGYSYEQINTLLKYLNDSFNQKTLEQAKQKYYDF